VQNNLNKQSLHTGLSSTKSDPNIHATHSKAAIHYLLLNSHDKHCYLIMPSIQHYNTKPQHEGDKCKFLSSLLNATTECHEKEVLLKNMAKFLS
jgi:hypothetical protein